MMFDKIKHYYDAGLWSINRVYNVVGKAISETEYREITGLVYPTTEQSDAIAERTTLRTS